MSQRSTTLPLYFWYRGSNSEFLRWQRSIHDAKWTFLPLFLASSITSFLFLTFVSCNAGIFANVSHYFTTAAFAFGIFIAWSIGMNLWTRLLWVLEFIPFAVVWSWWCLCTAPSCLCPVLSSASTTQTNFVLRFPNVAVGLSTALYWYFARHCCWHRNFQLSSSSFDFEFEFFIVWLDELYCSHCRVLVSR